MSNDDSTPNVDPWRNFNNTTAVLEPDPSRAAEMAATIAEHPVNRGEQPLTRANGQPIQLACKYDATHGGFSDPATLGKHYREVHPEYVRRHPDPVSCPECNKVLSNIDTWRKHLRKQHNITGLQPPAPEVEAYECTICGHRTPTRSGAANHVKRTHHEARGYGRHVRKVGEASVPAVVEKAKAKAVPVEHEHEHEHEPWRVDDIVLPVIRNLALPSGMVPVEHLGAVFTWRDATAAMLRDITTGQ